MKIEKLLNFFISNKEDCFVSITSLDSNQGISDVNRYLTLTNRIGVENQECACQVTILDNRSGFSLEDMNQLLIDKPLFDRVGRGDTLVSGFSLWVARKLIQLHGGKINILTKEFGTEYTFDFKFEKPAAFRSQSCQSQA